MMNPLIVFGFFCLCRGYCDVRLYFRDPSCTSTLRGYATVAKTDKLTQMYDHYGDESHWSFAVDRIFEDRINLSWLRNDRPFIQQDVTYEECTTGPEIDWYVVVRNLSKYTFSKCIDDLDCEDNVDCTITRCDSELGRCIVFRDHDGFCASKKPSSTCMSKTCVGGPMNGILCAVDQDCVLGKCLSWSCSGGTQTGNPCDQFPSYPRVACESGGGVCEQGESITGCFIENY